MESRQALELRERRFVVTDEPKWRKALRSLIAHKLTTLGPMTNHQLANACQVSVKAIAPRLTEMVELGEARDTGGRHSSVSGKGRKQVVWEAVQRA